MRRAVVMILLLAFVSLPLQCTHAMPNVHLDNTKTTITLQETVNFTAQVSYAANVTWYLDDINVQSEFGINSNYTFIPKATGAYFIKLSVNGFTNPPPIGAIKVTVLDQETTPPTPTPTVPEFPWIMVLPLFASVLFLALAVKHQRTRRS